MDLLDARGDYFFPKLGLKKEEEAVRDQVKELTDPCRGVTGLLLSVKIKHSEFTTNSMNE